MATYRLLIAAALLLLLKLPLGRSDLVLPPQNLPDLLDVAWAAVGLSLLYLGILRFSTDFADRPLFHWLQVSGDGLIVLLLLHYGGGLAGPFAILPLLLMISTAKLLRGRGAFLFVWLLLILLLLEFFLLGPEHTRLPLGQLLVYLLALVAVAFLADSLVVSLERSKRLTRERDVELGNLNLLNQEIIQQVDSGLLVLDRQNRVVLSNPAGRRLAGYERWQDVPVALDVVQPSLAAALRQGELHENREVSVASEGGERLSLLIRLIALPQGPYRLLILRDATELREREREAQMAALGRLAANIAHEIRNPLSSVRHATDLLREYVQDEPGSLHLFRILERETLRIDRIIDPCWKWPGRAQHIRSPSSCTAGYPCCWTSWPPTQVWPRCESSCPKRTTGQSSSQIPPICARSLPTCCRMRPNTPAPMPPRSWWRSPGTPRAMARWRYACAITVPEFPKNPWNASSSPFSPAMRGARALGCPWSASFCA
ncbi:hypothetical protein F0726_02128 [Acidithiobacillus caldus]|nr:hypothetical protein F0726_02128 [Acidithiobacillus caldus]